MHSHSRRGSPAVLPLLRLIFFAAAALGVGGDANPPPSKRRPVVYRLLNQGNCTASARGGGVIFGAQPPLRSRPDLPLHVIQCGDHAPAVGFAAGSGPPWASASYSDRTALANYLYAQQHGYRYTYFVVNDTQRASSWCRVNAMRETLSLIPTPHAVFYLDMDAYFVTDAPLSTHWIHSRKYRRALALDEGDELWPGVYPRLKTVPPGNMSHDTPMPVLQALFETNGAFEKVLATGRDVLNSGGGWLELGGTGVRRSLDFLERWFAASDTYEKGKYKWCFPYEQRVLQRVLAASPADRMQTGLLEDIVFQTHRSPCIAHLYSNKKRNGDNLKALDAVLHGRLMAQAGGGAGSVAFSEDNVRYTDHWWAPGGLGTLR